MAVSSATDLPAVKSLVAKIQGLLDHAEAAKPQSTIEPALPVADFINEIAALHEALPEEYDQPYRYSLVETAVRDVFYGVIQTTDIDNSQFVAVWNLLDIVLMCGDHGMCTPELVCWLIEELLDSQTTLGCRKVFDYLESRRERLAQKDFHKKNLVFLRSCNELLRRLSRAEDAIFCGRVFFFLFQTFPLGDKSSVNLRGEFHVDNITKFDEETPGGNLGPDGDEMEVDGKANDSTIAAAVSTDSKVDARSLPGKDGSKRPPQQDVLPNHELYPIFWRLQHDFSNPTRLFIAANFATFKQGLLSTIAKFKSSSSVVQTKATADHGRDNSRQADSADEAESPDDLVDNYNPKYLTSRDLFHLELSDQAFQRHILVQSLILIDFLLSLTESAKKKREALTPANRALLYAYTLNDEDARWASSTRAAITAYLGARGDGREYCRMIETVLARDKNWVRWKMESCPSIVRGPVPTELELAARKNAQESVRPRRVPDRPMGAMNLNFLDEDSAVGMPLLQSARRHPGTSIETLVDGLKTDQLDAEMATEEELVGLNTAIANKKWRALRKARATNLSLLDKVESTKDTGFESAFQPPETVNDADGTPLDGGD